MLLHPPQICTCPTSQVFAFSATCTNFVPEDNYSCATLRVNVGSRCRRNTGLPEISRAWGINQKGAWRTVSPAIRHPRSPRLRASVARAGRISSHSTLATRHPALSGAEGCFSNRHPCRLETTLNPSVPTTAPSLIVAQSPLFLRVCGGLFVAQGDHGIHAHRAPRRDVAREQRHGEQERCNGEIDCRVTRAGIEDQRREKVRDRCSTRKTENDSGSAKHGTLAQNELKNVAPLRTQGHADADFARAPARVVRDHAVDSDGGEQKRGCGKKAEQRGAETRLGDGFRKHFCHRLEIFHGQRRIECLNLLTNRRAQLRRITMRAH